jgi:hypothetical protein
MNEEHKDSISNNSHPKIIDSEDKKISEQKPPNDKILYFNIVKENDTTNSKREEEPI